MTIPQGYNPARVKVEIRFGVWDGRFGNNGWDTSESAGSEVESNIDDLNWMGGLKATGGPSPVVRVRSYNVRYGHLVDTHLMPPQFPNAPWVIDGGIEWGKSLRRPQDMKRVFQEASFTLLLYSSFGISPPQERTQLSGGFYLATSTVNTPLAIAGSPSSQAPEALIYTLARNICNDSRNNPCRGTRLGLERKSLTFEIPVGTAVFVPGHQI